MSSKICPKCGHVNSAQMNFCSNCGQSLHVGTPAVRPDEPPPTVMINQPPRPQPSPPQSSPFEAARPPGNPFSQPSPPPRAAAAPPPAQPPKKSNKGLIFGVIGCLGLLLFSGIGLVILGVVFRDSLFGSGRNANYGYPSPSPQTSNSFVANTEDADNDNSNSSTTGPESVSSTLLLAILKARQQVGSFNQTGSKAVAAKDYFPEDNGAAQATYSNGSKTVYLTVGMFDSTENAKKNFDDQLRGIKGGGGKVTYQNAASDGTISAIYENKGYYFAEYCNTSNFCNRIHSDDRPALKSFFESYATK